MRYLGNSIVFGVGQTSVIALVQPHSFVWLGFHPCSFSQNSPCIHSVHSSHHQFLSLLDYFHLHVDVHKYHSKQTSPSTLLIPLHFPPRFSFFHWQASQRSHPCSPYPLLRSWSTPPSKGVWLQPAPHHWTASVKVMVTPMLLAPTDHSPPSSYLATQQHFQQLNAASLLKHCSFLAFIMLPLLKFLWPLYHFAGSSSSCWHWMSGFSEFSAGLSFLSSTPFPFYLFSSLFTLSP